MPLPSTRFSVTTASPGANQPLWCSVRSVCQQQRRAKDKRRVPLVAAVRLLDPRPTIIRPSDRIHCHHPLWPLLPVEVRPLLLLRRLLYITGSDTVRLPSKSSICPEFPVFPVFPRYSNALCSSGEAEKWRLSFVAPFMVDRNRILPVQSQTSRWCQQCAFWKPEYIHRRRGSGPRNNSTVPSTWPTAEEKPSMVLTSWSLSCTDG